VVGVGTKRHLMMVPCLYGYVIVVVVIMMIGIVNLLTILPEP
jgi:hypothetical protein